MPQSSDDESDKCKRLILSKQEDEKMDFNFENVEILLDKVFVCGSQSPFKLDADSTKICDLLAVKLHTTFANVKNALFDVFQSKNHINFIKKKKIDDDAITSFEAFVKSFKTTTYDDLYLFILHIFTLYDNDTGIPRQTKDFLTMNIPCLKTTVHDIFLSTAQFFMDSKQFLLFFEPFLNWQKRNLKQILKRCSQIIYVQRQGIISKDYILFTISLPDISSVDLNTLYQQCPLNLLNGIFTKPPSLYVVDKYTPTQQMTMNADTCTKDDFLNKLQVILSDNLLDETFVGTLQIESGKVQLFGPAITQDDDDNDNTQYVSDVVSELPSFAYVVTDNDTVTSHWIIEKIINEFEADHEDTPNLVVFVCDPKRTYLDFVANFPKDGDTIKEYDSKWSSIPKSVKTVWTLFKNIDDILQKKLCFGLIIVYNISLLHNKPKLNPDPLFNLKRNNHIICQGMVLIGSSYHLPPKLLDFLPWNFLSDYLGGLTSKNFNMISFYKRHFLLVNPPIDVDLKQQIPRAKSTFKRPSASDTLQVTRSKSSKRVSNNKNTNNNDSNNNTQKMNVKKSGLTNMQDEYNQVIWVDSNPHLSSLSAQMLMSYNENDSFWSLLQQMHGGGIFVGSYVFVNVMNKCTFGELTYDDQEEKGEALQLQTYCSICLCSDERCDVILHPCKHTYCSNCLKKWMVLLTSDHECPSCNMKDVKINVLSFHKMKEKDINKKESILSKIIEEGTFIVQEKLDEIKKMSKQTLVITQYESIKQWYKKKGVNVQLWNEDQTECIATQQQIVINDFNKHNIGKMLCKYPSALILISKNGLDKLQWMSYHNIELTHFEQQLILLGCKTQKYHKIMNVLTLVLDVIQKERKIQMIVANEKSREWMQCETNENTYVEIKGNEIFVNINNTCLWAIDCKEPFTVRYNDIVLETKIECFSVLDVASKISSYLRFYESEILFQKFYKYTMDFRNSDCFAKTIAQPQESTDEKKGSTHTQLFFFVLFFCCFFFNVYVVCCCKNENIYIFFIVFRSGSSCTIDVRRCTK